MPKLNGLKKEPVLVYATIIDEWVMSYSDSLDEATRVGELLALKELEENGRAVEVCIVKIIKTLKRTGISCCPICSKNMFLHSRNEAGELNLSCSCGCIFRSARGESLSYFINRWNNRTVLK